MLQKQIIQATGGMNKDDDSRYLPAGDYIEMLNLRCGANQAQGDRGLVETFISNYEIEFPDVEGATFIPIAVAVDEQQDMAIILAYQGGDTPYFQIYKFDILTDTITKIFEVDADEWNITATTKIYNPRILDGKIIWTDNVNPVLYIDLSRLEISYLNSIGIDEGSVPVQWDENTEYSAGDLVYYGASIYRSLTGATPTPTATPTEAPTPTEASVPTPDESEDWEYVCEILDCYMDISSIGLFTLSANPPTIALTPTYFSDQNRISNNLRNRTFQFTYRYVYIDYRKSTYAPPSIVPDPSQEENIDGTQNTDQKYHNTIVLSINTGNEEIRTIEIIGRSSEDPAAWFYVGEISLFDKDGRRVIPTDTTYSFYFYNDVIRQIVDATEVYTLFTYVPIRAKHMELIEGNRLVFANITEGYDRIQQSVTTELTYEYLEAVNYMREFLSVTIGSVIPLGDGGVIAVLMLKLPTVKKEGTYYLNIKDNYGTEYNAEYTYEGDGEYPITVKNGLLADIEANGWDGEIRECISVSDYTICFFRRTFGAGVHVYGGWVFQGTSYIENTGETASNKYPMLKTGETHNWGIIYRDDAGVMSPIIGAGEIKVEIPFPTQADGDEITKRPVVKLRIYHLPPVWATSYEVVYLGNDSFFLQLLGYMLSTGRDSDQREDPGGDTDVRFGRISVDFMINRSRDKISNWAVEQYVFQEGDRIRFIGYTTNDNIIERYETLYDVPIHGVFTDTVYIDPSDPDEEKTIDMEFLYFQQPEGMTIDDTPAIVYSYLVEIYRPQREANVNLYYTTGMTFPIETDEHGNKYHTGGTEETDQVLNESGVPTFPAVVTNTAHNAWKYLRNFKHQTLDQTLHIYIEGQYASDYYLTNKLTSSGVPIPQLDNYRQTELTKRVRHGGKYNFGTELNQLAKFDYDDFMDMKDEFGDIEGVRELGFVLKVIQYTKITSIYISRIESYAGNSESQFLFSDRVFGSARPGLEDYGTRHPDSICVYNNNLYFWDQSEGVVARDAANGQTPISMYKMISFFQDKATEMDAVLTANQEVYFGYNMRDNMLFCTFGDGTTFETITFSEIENRWKYTTDAIIHKWFWLGKRLFHIHNGNVYEWWRDEGQGYLELSGEQKEGKVTVIGNEDPLKNKTFNAIAVYQDGDTPQVEVVVPAKGSAVTGDMESIATAWEKREGVYYGKILRDLNTPGLTGTNNLYMNGRKLRGQYCEVTLTFDKTDGKVRLFNVMLTATPSERSL